MTDNSDGLVADLGLIARRSRVAIDLNSNALTPCPLLVEAGAVLDRDPWEWVLAGGEDHTLLGTTPVAAPSGFKVIGRVHAASHTRPVGVTVDGKAPAYGQGWVAF